ncbi:MAG: hypothetical protein IJK31_09090 [Ruminococcus sp.]|nr:hypothetical protein [Ruminococcus sp.]
MKRTTKIIILSVIAALTISGCGKETSHESKSQDSKETKEVWPEATSTVASTILIEASQYYYQGSIHPNIIHDIIKDDSGFDTHFLEKHPAFHDLEYVIEFETRGSRNAFCIQKNTSPVTIGCNGEFNKLSDWGFETWDDVLEYYNLNDK